MYLVDSGPRVIHAFAFDPDHGTISDGRILVTVPEDVGAPDGMTVDAAGDLWVAIYGGGGSTATPPTARCATHTPSQPASARAARSADPGSTNSSLPPRPRVGLTSSGERTPQPGWSTGSTPTRPAGRPHHFALTQRGGSDSTDDNARVHRTGVTS